VTVGINELPLTSPVSVTAGELIWVGMQVDTSSISMAQRADGNDAGYFTNTGAPPSTAPSLDSSNATGTAYFVKVS
jgi:hypothetical protein